MTKELHSGVHPDPDALNAFVEGALPEHERGECLAHLAECSQCREVVFLTQKAAEMEEPVAAPGTPVSFWRRLLRPMVVVPVVATVVVAAFSFGLYQRSSERHPQVTASAKAHVEMAPAAKAQQQTPELLPVPRKASPLPVLREREQPPAAPAPPPAPPAPPVVASAPLPAPPPAQAAAAETGGAVHLAEGAGVTGTILDQAGGVIASARVELKNEETGVTHTSTSDANGQYNIAGLAPGRYDLSVTSPGFKKFLQTRINVQPQQVARLDSSLQVGAATESVTVTAEASLLKTESGEASHQVGLEVLDQLPLLTGVRGNFRAVTGASSVYTLPDKSTPVSVATKDKLVVAVDSAGALLVSESAGKNWTRVKATWKGKAIRVVTIADAMFQLTTDPASTWLSTDGRHWSKAPTSR